MAPTVDPIQIKNEYFAAASADPAFPALLQIIRSDPRIPAAAANKVMNDPKLKYLGRSIILAWYLGVWYDPKTLERYNGPGDQAFPVPPVKVISPTAYTQGWTWRVAQAHPMGYSELRYGYWANDPLSLDDYIKSIIGSSDMCAERIRDPDVVIVGSGIAGALIAKVLATAGKKVLILEAGEQLPPDINGYMDRFLRATAKVPESPYPPDLFDSEGADRSRHRECRSSDRAQPGAKGQIRRLAGSQAELSDPARTARLWQHL